MVNLLHLGELFEANGEVANVGCSLRKQLAHHHQDGPISEFNSVAYVIFGKGFKTFNSARILCLHGCGADALALCSSLFENLVDLLYIRQDAAPRAHNYLAFEQVDKYYQIRKVLRREDLSAEKRMSYQSFLDDFTPKVQGELANFPKQSCWFRAGRDGTMVPVKLRDRAEDVGLGLHYDELYYHLCGHKHTSPGAAAGFMLRHDEGADIIVGPNVKGVHPALLHSAEYFIDICHALQEALGLGMTEEITTLNCRLVAAAERVRGAHPDLCE